MDEPITECVITPAVSEDSKHAHWMKEALKMGETALEHGETPVGCVLVYDGKIVGRGMNDTNRSMNGTRHAEFLAIAEMLQSYPKTALQSTDLYVTVEPCVMCASALKQYRIRSVYFGCANDRFGGTGGVLTIHSDHSIDPTYPVYGGLFQKEAIMLLRRFYIQENDKAPNPRPKKNRELNTAFDSVREIVATSGGEVLPIS
ncbi:tRNA-specific adenosine deaminase subunit tad2 [Penicillium daleae]|uniref:tRNA(adenine(34)) deaminase n=1 Tax=Penicillium daleae TaxID=63821 RepID=A0AAD6CIR0_9EURO|nr:tRNA-specific adenosine deaminase subunit tad2 [Penicillium daleae]KAJ5464679.1 tRNA-specific adenosine deaminase subunit tad2 [Penicillium daleae]